jgi:predicted transcriptional regulator
MTKTAMPFSTNIPSLNASELREKVFQDKAARRRYWVTAPIPEKLRVLEEMRDVTRALKKTREENRTRIRAAAAASRI